MKTIPSRKSELNKKSIEKFKEFLVARGSQIMATTNEYEVLRFTGEYGRVCLVHTNKAGALNWSEPAADAYSAFLNSGAWRAAPKTERSKAAFTRMNRLRTLADRDGPGCFYCGADFPLESMTIEHFVAVSAGGPDHLSNMALACGGCNRSVGHLPVAEKLRSVAPIRSTGRLTLLPASECA